MPPTGTQKRASDADAPTNIIIRSVYTVIDLKAAPVRLEPVTVDTNELGYIFNPCGVGTGGLAKYKVDVVPPGIVPDSAIHWSVASGGVTMYAGYDTGRTAIIHGGSSESDYKLEVTIDGLPSTYKPYIFGKVLEPKTVQVRAYVISDTNGVAAVSNSTINAWIAEANRIYKQVAMTFTLASVNCVTNRPDWFDIGSVAEFYDMTSYTNETGGLELYCVNSLYGNTAGLSNPSSVSGARRGIAVKQGAGSLTFAHEVGHACWLDDIYIANLDDSLISQERAGLQNWSGGDESGFYPPELTHKNFIPRLLMLGVGGEGHVDISLGPVRAKMTTPPYYDTYIATGLLDSMTRTPEH